MIYHTYNDYWQAVQTVKKMLRIPNISEQDRRECTDMIYRIAETEQLEEYKVFKHDSF